MPRCRLLSSLAEIYESSGLNRPTDLNQIQMMLDNANVIITAWDGEEIVGFLRAFTDYCFDCYLNDLAVVKKYQRHGIGKRLIAELESLLHKDVMILVVASKDAIDYYPRLGFKYFANPHVVLNKITL